MRHFAVAHDVLEIIATEHATDKSQTNTNHAKRRQSANAPNGLKMSPVLAAPSLRSPETLTVIPCLPGVRPRTSPWMVVGAPAADWDRRRTPDTPDSPVILHVAEADMVAVVAGGGAGICHDTKQAKVAADGRRTDDFAFVGLYQSPVF